MCFVSLFCELVVFQFFFFFFSVKHILRWLVARVCGAHPWHSLLDVSLIKNHTVIGLVQACYVLSERSWWVSKTIHGTPSHPPLYIYLNTCFFFFFLSSFKHILKGFSLTSGVWGRMTPEVVMHTSDTHGGPHASLKITLVLAWCRLSYYYFVRKRLVGPFHSWDFHQATTLVMVQVVIWMVSFHAGSGLGWG